MSPENRTPQENLALAEERVGRSLGRMSTLEAKLTRLQGPERQRIEVMQDAATQASQRETLDLNSPAVMRDKSGESIRTSGGIIDSRVVKKPVDKFGKRNRDKIPEEVPIAPLVGGPVFALRGLMAAKRAKKQQYKQQRAKRNEQVAGTFIGRGKQKNFATKKARLLNSYEAYKSLANGEITREEAHKRISERRGPDGKIIREYKTPGSVNRAVRAERRGSVKTRVLARQPIAGRIRQARISSVERKIEAEDDRLRKLNQSRIQHLNEIEDEDARARKMPY